MKTILMIRNKDGMYVQGPETLYSKTGLYIPQVKGSIINIIA